jgi:hypothetical protein
VVVEAAVGGEEGVRHPGGREVAVRQQGSVAVLASEPQAHGEEEKEIEPHLGENNVKK